MDPFTRIERFAKLWLKEPTDVRFAKIVAHATSATPEVPPERRDDWAKLVTALPVADPRTRARIEGLVRACKLFAEPPPSPPLPPLLASDPVDRLPGLGPTTRDALAENGVRCVGDLVWTLPVAYDDLRAPESITSASARAAHAQRLGLPSARICISGVVKSASLVPMAGRRMVRVTLIGEDNATLAASWFFAAHGILAAAKVGSPGLLVGRVRIDAKGRPQMAHPDFVPDESSARVVRARYPRIGAGEAALRKAIGAALDRLAAVPDPVPAAVAARERFPPCDSLLRALHGQAGILTGPPEAPARRAAFERLAWGEAFTRVWERLKAEARQGKGNAPKLPLHRAVLARLRAELGFTLTHAQTAAIDTISKELARETPMRRLLLGDVGTGKTVVALAAAAQCVSARYQTAILAPTSVLAEQYMDAVAPLARATGAPIALVMAGGGASRKRALETIAEGKIAIAIGTHALLSEGVTFARLGLVIVDEQHRLGVAQRLALVHKGKRPHLLTLSATPIPRTMALALRGELATTVLGERPRGRTTSATLVWSRSDLPKAVLEIKRACARGEKAFFVCPRIANEDEDEDEDGTLSATKRAAALAEALSPVRVALIHGGLRPEAKRRAMRAFRGGDAQVLVGTTVIEVGVDVPEATLMIVDGAERFGLAQLHQLRGRVGRGERPGSCILLHGPIEPLAERRLDALRTLSTGTEIARADLELRGAGDLGGTRQSGVEEELVYLDAGSSPDWLARVEGDARKLFADDPNLAQGENAGVALAVRRLGTVIAVREEAG